MTFSLSFINLTNGQVVYGDTDSVFVNSNVTELAEALKISAMLKKAVNDRYKLLEIDLDAVFQRLLLLQKKKYAAIKVEDGTRTTTEVKGLDMKRREYCALSKRVSQYVFVVFLTCARADGIIDMFWNRFFLVNLRRLSLKIFMSISRKLGGISVMGPLNWMNLSSSR